MNNEEWISLLQSRLTAAETKVKELENDASRYRYLRNAVPVDGELCIARKSYDGRHTYLTLDERDRLIDAELDKLKGQS